MTETRILKSTPYKNTTLSSKVIHALATTKGVTWLDRVRIPYKSDQDKDSMDIRHYQQEDCFQNKEPKRSKFQVKPPNERGRFPANLLVSGDVLNDGRIRISKWGKTNESSIINDSIFTQGQIRGSLVNRFIGDSGSYSRYFDLDKWWDELLERIKN